MERNIGMKKTRIKCRHVRLDYVKARSRHCLPIQELSYTNEWCCFVTALDLKQNANIRNGSKTLDNGILTIHLWNCGPVIGLYYC